jgi:ribonucleoside-triphosphate reductase
VIDTPEISLENLPNQKDEDEEPVDVGELLGVAEIGTLDVRNGRLTGAAADIGWNLSAVQVNGGLEDRHASVDVAAGGGALVRQGRTFALSALNFMRERLIQYQETTCSLYNLEATPAESTSYRLAKIDRERYPDIRTAGKDEPFYTNSSQLPVEYTTDLSQALDHQEELQRKYTGGTAFHCFLGGGIENVDTCRKLVKAIAENTAIPYYTISPTFSVCTDHGYLNGRQPLCPKCGKETEVYSRIVGYYRPVKNWNKGKAEEFRHRREFEPAIPPARPSPKRYEEQATTAPSCRRLKVR